jgi:hypothetical protein
MSRIREISQTGYGAHREYDGILTEDTFVHMFAYGWFLTRGVPCLHLIFGLAQIKANCLPVKKD